MQHTLIAVFDNRNDAQKAMDELLAGGFKRPDMRMSEGDMKTTAGTAGTTTHEGESMGGSIKHFFTDLFGSDRSERLGQYSEAIARGNYVLTVTAPSEDEVERAADIVERFGPIDIDEKSSEWAGGAGSASTAATGAASRGKQQQASMSQQSMQSGQGSAQAASSGSQQFANTESAAIPVVKEELKVGKREVQRGGMRIFSHVVETPVDESVNLREEHVTVQRRAIDKMVDPADVPAFQETSFEMRESAEEAVVNKSARIVEEVVIGKEVTSHEEHIKDTLRHTEVDVEQLSTPEDETYYRSHWDRNYATSGKTYDEYAPAYQYGSSMHRSELYRNRPWDDVETDLRSDWTKRHPGSMWENFKDAVRHGWDRITS